jgi:ABC-type transport system involved in cytochrome c biogenesis ATPase subunit
VPDVPPPAPPALDARGVGWRYPRSPWLLRDLSLSVAPGELLRVRGGNGSGKSTLLRLLAGCTAPRRGWIRAAGRVGYLPQSLGELPPTRADRLLALLGGPAGPGDPAVAAHRATRADRLSGGTARRLVLEAVLSLPAPVLVLDEPGIGLDDAALARLAAAVSRRLADGTAVVVAEHGTLPLPGGRELDLGGAAGTGHVRVVLGGAGCFRGVEARDGVLELHVPPGERDALLAEALGAGWAVLAVGPRR